MTSNNTQKNSSKRKMTNTVLLFIVFLVALLYLAVVPSIQSINSLRAEILNEKVNSEKKYQTEKNAIELRNKINKIDSSVSDLENVFISKNRELEFITALENIASKNNITQKINLSLPGVQVTSTKTNKNKATATSSPEKTIESSPLSISVSGNYRNIINYLLEINMLEYYVNIESLDFSRADKGNQLPGDESDDNKNINLNIIARTYWK